MCLDEESPSRLISEATRENVNDGIGEMEQYWNI
jgi:hypothetical protein